MGGTAISTDYSNGFLERVKGGGLMGELSIDGVDLSPIEGVYFKESGKTYLWIKRRPILEYDYSRSTYIRRQREPQWETYLKKTVIDEKTAYVGQCVFLKLKYKVVAIRDSVLGKEKERINFFVERLPMDKQDIINKIKDRNNG